MKSMPDSGVKRADLRPTARPAQPAVSTTDVTIMRRAGPGTTTARASSLGAGRRPLMRGQPEPVGSRTVYGERGQNVTDHSDPPTSVSARWQYA